MNQHNLPRTMPLVLMLALTLSIIGMVWAAKLEARSLSLVAAGLSPLALVLFGLSADRRRSRDPLPSARMAAALIALAYTWGALALVCVYTVAPVSWYHSGQYAAGMALIAAGLWIYRSRLTPGHALASPLWRKRMQQVTLLQAIAATLGLAFLIGAGKLMTQKGDWPANHIFLAGGIAIIILSIMAVRNQIKTEALS